MPHGQRQEHAEETGESTFGKAAQKIVVLAEVAVVILVLMTCFRQRVPAPAPEPTPTMTPSPEPTFTPTKTPTPSPTPTCTPTPTPIPCTVKEVEKGHKFKPYTGYWVYDIKNSAQYKLQKAAWTDVRTGVRIVADIHGYDRYCVALGTYWAGGHPEHIGRCVDMVMVNGAVLPCVLADVKRQEDAKRNRYGKINNDVIEFIVDERHIPDGVYGDMSAACPEFEGDVEYMIIYDEWIEGFGKEK